MSFYQMLRQRITPDHLSVHIFRMEQEQRLNPKVTQTVALSLIEFIKMHSTSLKHKSHCQPRQVHTSREFNKQSKVHTVVTKLNRQTAEIKHKANCSMCQERATQSDLCPKSKAQFFLITEHLKAMRSFSSCKCQDRCCMDGRSLVSPTKCPARGRKVRNKLISSCT